jgi:DNA helicase II / ATP-dependent DNA helicase PcrA
MLTYDEFQALVQAAVPNKFGNNWLNSQQNDAVSAQPSPPVFIVAGPGTGKTTVLALRVLKHIFVDGYAPDSIMATTFTRKAAAELRSRILSWGVATRQEALQQAQEQENQQRVQWLESLDINQVKTGTLDSLAEEMISDDRQAGEITPTVIESFMAKGLLRENALFTNGRHSNDVLQTHLSNFNRDANSLSDKLKICHSLADRFIHDVVNINAYASQSEGHQILVDIINDYHNYLINNQLMDFALLEQEIFNRLQSGRLKVTTNKLNVLLIDEFQDTNYLQEQIYYLLCQNSKASLTVVGDDDQSIFRFRGATVEIFSNFPNRIKNDLGVQWNPRQINLINNYRSSSRIVEICNHFITADQSFQQVRVPNKQSCIAAANWANDTNINIPILGIFRNSAEELANDISRLLNDVFRGNGRTITISNNQQFIIKCNSINGDFGDAVLLGKTVQERTNPKHFQDNPRDRLPLFLRQIMLRDHNIDVFNPRGRDFTTIPEVMQCLGIMLECIDPNGQVQNDIDKMKGRTRTTLNNWRSAGRHFAQSNPAPSQPNTNSLEQFVNDWGNRNWHNSASEWPLLELLFTTITWFPLLQRNPEGQIYLETIARTITVASQISNYRSMIKNEGTVHDNKSVKKAIRTVFEPIAEGEVEVDEDIMSYVPKSVFPIMTVHQAKGLEFPLVIVDVGSDFKTNHSKQKAFRYPEDGGDVHSTEDEIANFSPVGQSRLQRTALDRAFDDITRDFFVAKSRPQNILLFVGLMTQLTWKSKKNSYQVPSVATGDLRNGGRTYDFVPAEQWTPNSPANTIALI